MNPSTALARVLVDELVRHGVREAVLAPGSRNAPLSFALHAADAAGQLRLHVRIDERTAGFLALGLAKASRVPVPVVTTSGTAVANLHPAVLEASYAGVPLLVLTADRPVELRGTGANQTVDQVKIFGTTVRLFHDVAAPEERAGQNAYWRSLVSRAVAAATGALTLDPGPVHLNVALREPLVPDGDDRWPESLDARAVDRPWTRAGRGFSLSAAPYAGSARTLVIVGDASEQLATAAVGLARSRGWPLVAEPVSAARGDAPYPGSLLLSAAEFLAAHRPERVLVVGRPTLSRAVGALLRDPTVAVDVVASSPRWADPPSRAQEVLAESVLTGMQPAVGEGTVTAGRPAAQGDPAFRAAWRTAAETAAGAVTAFLAVEPWPTGPHVARVLADAVAGADSPLLVVGSSSPVRDLDLVAGAELGLIRVLANRGAAGIDGTVSTAVGAALAHQREGGGRAGFPAYALMGDLTFLHDVNGLVLGPDEPRPDLTITVVNDDGGALFGLLEQGAPEFAPAFERIFGTPHGADLGELCAATRTPYALAATAGELRSALAPAAGFRVVEVRTDRHGARDLHARLRAAVRAALA